MKRQYIDVELHIEQGDIADAINSTFGKEVLAKDIIDRVRTKAEEEVQRVGGRLVGSATPEFYIRRGSHVLAGGDYLLIASRWLCDVPNNFDPARAAAGSR